MPEIMPATSYILPDEPCCSLSELNELAPDFHTMRRYQILHVVRNDRLAEYRTDLGLASDFRTLPFQIVGGFKDGNTGRIYIEETVGGMKDMADQMRNRDESDRTIPVSNLLAGYADQKEADAKRHLGKVLYSIAKG